MSGGTHFNHYEDTVDGCVTTLLPATARAASGRCQWTRHLQHLHLLAAPRVRAVARLGLAGEMLLH